MSKIGKLPIEINSATTVSLEGQTVKIAGPKGNAEYVVPTGLQVSMAEGKLVLTMKDENKRAMYGLTRANIANIIKGLDTGFEKKLELAGVGYRAQIQGVDLVLSLGFSHPVKFKPLTGVTITVADNVITISGSDKAVVGEMAAKIRAVKPPEPYKGKGIKYAGERVRRKAGKAAKAVGGAK
jgi:large subunit ribosomal protein L6